MERRDANNWLEEVAKREEANLPDPADLNLLHDLMGVDPEGRVLPSNIGCKHFSGHSNFLRVLIEYNGSSATFQPKFPRIFRNSTSGV